MSWGTRNFLAQNLKQLRTLNLSHTGITDVAASQLDIFPELKFLNISGTDVTYEGLTHIAKLSLRKVDISKCKHLPFTPCSAKSKSLSLARPYCTQYSMHQQPQNVPHDKEKKLLCYERPTPLSSFIPLLGFALHALFFHCFPSAITEVLTFIDFKWQTSHQFEWLAESSWQASSRL